MAATATRNGTSANGKQRNRSAAPAVVKKHFTASAHQHDEYGGLDVNVTPGAAAQTLTPVDIPASGYLRHADIYVTTSTAGTGGTASADYPFNILNEITLSDVNGGFIFGPMDGYKCMLVNLIGGYAFNADPASQPTYSATVTAPAFMLRVPLELQHNDGLGAVPNMNSSQQYRLRLVVNPATVIWGTQPSPIPVLRVRVWIETWTRPDDVSLGGVPQSQEPPHVGTTQYHTFQTRPLVIGENYLQVAKVGNPIRWIAFIFRDAGGARSDVVASATLQGLVELRIDGRVIHQRALDYMKTLFAEGVRLAGAPPVGVYVFAWHNDALGHWGDGTPELWLTTLQPTRLELRAPSVAVAGSVDILVNDVAKVAVGPMQRPSFEGGTGFDPNSGGYNG